MRRPLGLTVAVAAIALALGAPHLAGSKAAGDPRAERERVRAERARVASRIDTSTASLAEVDAALDTLESNLRTQQAALRRTEADVARAERDIVDADRAIERLTSRVGALEAEMTERAVRAYVRPPGDDVLRVLETKDFTSAAERAFYVELRAEGDADVADRLDGASAELAYQRRTATAARARADAERAEQARRTRAVTTAAEQQRRLADHLEATIAAQTARSVELADTDRALSTRIAQQQAALVTRIAAQEDAARRAAATRNVPPPTTTTPPSNQDPSGGETAPLPPVSGGGGGTGTGGIPLCTVGGITVNCAIEARLRQMEDAAAADGIHLEGDGYRLPSVQIELRRQHCGTSPYAIYEMPSGSCHPPTAIPGTSQHEIGLAIDFKHCHDGEPVHDWLQGHAAAFGFHQLPSESWHWSTTGS